MSTMNIPLPDWLKSFVDEQVAGRGYSTSGEYVRKLIHADQDRERLRKLLLDWAASPATKKNGPSPSARTAPCLADLDEATIGASDPLARRARGRLG